MFWTRGTPELKHRSAGLRHGVFRDRCATMPCRRSALRFKRLPGYDQRLPSGSLAQTVENQYKPRVSTNALTEIRKTRLQKAASLRSLGISPYPSRSKRTHYAKTILDDYETLQGKEVTVAGRL